MKRKLAYILVVLVFGTIAIMGYQIFRKLAFRAAVRERIATLPDLELFFSLDGDRFRGDSLPPEKAVILLYFHSDCVFCTGEIKDILDHPDLIASTSLLLISSEPTTTLRAFQRKYKLGTYPHIQVLQDTSGVFYRTFGTKVFPSAFLYNSHRELLKQYRGQVPANTLYRIIGTG